MSRVGSAAIKVDKDVKILISGSDVKVTGKLGEFNHTMSPDLEVVMEGDLLKVLPKKLTKKSRSMWGLSVRLLKNYIEGVKNGYKSTLEMTGVGFRAACDGKVLSMSIGFSHQVLYVVPEGITIKCPKPTTIEITGFDKRNVGQISADIRSLRKPEPYKGKGIRYDNEQIRRKEGKKK